MLIKKFIKDLNLKFSNINIYSNLCFENRNLISRSKNFKYSFVPVKKENISKNGSLNNKNNKFFLNSYKKNFSEKNNTEDLIEQILQTKANNNKKTFVAQENANLSNSIYSQNKSNYTNHNNNNHNSNYNQNSNNANFNQIQNQEYFNREREINFNSGNGNANYNYNSYNRDNNNNQNGFNGFNSNQNYSNSTNNQNNSNVNNYNQNTSNYPNRKRNRISIIRDGMNITLNLRRVILNIKLLN